MRPSLSYFLSNWWVVFGTVSYLTSTVSFATKWVSALSLYVWTFVRSRVILSDFHTLWIGSMGPLCLRVILSPSDSSIAYDLLLANSAGVSIREMFLSTMCPIILCIAIAEFVGILYCQDFGSSTCAFIANCYYLYSIPFTPFTLALMQVIRFTLEKLAKIRAWSVGARVCPCGQGVKVSPGTVVIWGIFITGLLFCCRLNFALVDVCLPGYMTNDYAGCQKWMRLTLLSLHYLSNPITWMRLTLLSLNYPVN